MEKMLSTTNGTGRQRRTVVEIINRGDDFLGSTRTMTLQDKFRQVFGQTQEETTEMIIREAVSSEAITGTILATTGKIAVLGSQGLSFPPKK
jgi:hypothetical protein